MKKLATLLVVSCILLMSCADSSTTHSDMPAPSETGAELLLNVTAEAGGTVPTELNGKYPVNTWVELTASPLPGFSFYRWTVYYGGSATLQYTRNQNPARFTLQNDTTIVATFREANKLFHFDLIDPLGGIPAVIASFAVGNYLEGEAIGLMVRSGEFDRWVVYSSDFEVLEIINQNVITFVMPPHDVILAVEYKGATH